MSGALPTLAIGVDIGGTNMSAALVDGVAGRVITKSSIETLPLQGPDDGMRRLRTMIERVVSQASVSWDALAGIGIGCTGPLDLDKGLVQNPFTLPTWDDLPIVHTLSKAFHKPVVLLNDAQAAAVGEHQAGAGRGSRHMAYVTVSTGVGGGLILNDRLYQGLGFLAGEVGHHSINYNGHLCYCGRRGCWEMYASGTAIAKMAQARVRPESALWHLASGQPETITARHVGEAAKLADPLALDVLHEAGVYLGIGISNLINVLALEVIVLGGGVMQSHQFILPTMHEVIQQQHYTQGETKIRITLAELGLNAGVIGAACALLLSLEQAL